MDDAGPMIAFEHVAHRYASRDLVLSDIDFDVASGQLLVVIGASGSGKTTLLKLVNRLLEPSEGRVRVGGEDVRERDPIALRRSIGYVFQRFGLFPHLTLAENVAVGPRLSGWSSSDIAARTGRAARAARPAAGRFSVTRASYRVASSSGWGWRVRWQSGRASC